MVHMGVSVSSHKGAANWRIAAGGRWQSMIKPKARSGVKTISGLFDC